MTGLVGPGSLGVEHPVRGGVVVGLGWVVLCCVVSGYLAKGAVLGRNGVGCVDLASSSSMFLF